MRNYFTKLLFIFSFLTSSCAFAQDDYSLRMYHGKVSNSNLGQILFGDISGYDYDLKVTALDVGYLLAPEVFDLPIDLYAKAGLSHFNEDNAQDDVYEGTLYIKAYWNIDFFKNRVRLGLGEGLSYTSNILIWEKTEAIETGDKYAYLLNYLDISIDLDIGKLVRYEPLYGTSFGWAMKHRSGIRGLINGVEEGGSNYVGFYLESNF